MSELRGRARALVEAGRADAPTTADRARVRAALAARLAAIPAPDPTPNGAPATAAPAGIGAKLIAAGALIGAVAVGGGVVAGRASAPPVESARHGVESQALRRARAIEQAAVHDTAPAAPPSTSIDVAPSPVVTSAPSPRASAPPVAVRAPAPPAPEITTAEPDPPAPKASSLLEETKLLGEAQTALGRGDAQAALAKLDELGARHPGGLLREERLAARILALCAAGRAEQARREAEVFLTEMRGSIQAGRVRASCAFAKKDDRGSP